jgi:hypothetical protein
MNAADGFAMIPRDLLWDRDVTRNAKIVYLGLSARINRAQQCWPSQRTLADDLGIARSSVQEGVEELEAAGVIRTDPRSREDGSTTSTLYTLTGRPPEAHTDRSSVRGGPESGQGWTAHRSGVDRSSVRGGPESGQQERESENESQKNESQGTKTLVAGSSLVEQFDAFWAVYPKKAGKGAARKAWERAVKKTPPALIIAGARRYAAQVANADPKFTKYPQGWLNDERWTDDVDVRPGSTLTDKNRALVALIQSQKEGTDRGEARDDAAALDR